MFSRAPETSCIFQGENDRRCPFDHAEWKTISLRQAGHGLNHGSNDRGGDQNDQQPIESHAQPTGAVPMFKNGIDARAPRAEALVQPWCDFRDNRQRDSPYLRLQIFNRRSTEAVFCIVLCRGTCAEISVTSALLLA